jgi:hypothetical protein
MLEDDEIGACRGGLLVWLHNMDIAGAGKTADGEEVILLAKQFLPR